MPALLLRTGGLLSAVTALAVAGPGIAALLGAVAGTVLAVAFAVGALAQELEIIHLDFSRVAVLAVTVRPLAGTEPALHVDLAALVDETFNDVGVAAPGDDVVPFRVLPGFTVAVTVALGSRKAE